MGDYLGFSLEQPGPGREDESFSNDVFHKFVLILNILTLNTCPILINCFVNSQSIMIFQRVFSGKYHVALCFGNIVVVHEDNYLYSPTKFSLTFENDIKKFIVKVLF